MKLILPESVSFTARVTEDEIRKRMAFEVLEQIGALTEAGMPLPGVKYSMTRGSGRSGGYVITVTGPAAPRLALPRSAE